MDFEDRLVRAIQRGEKRAEQQAADARRKALTEEDFKRLHTQYRLRISEHLESCVRQLAHHFPGFRYETIFGEKGWGAACSRDDLRLAAGKRSNEFSRLEIVVRPFSSYHVLDLAGRGTIRNKEVFSRNYFENVADANPDKFVEIADAWVLEYAELFAAAK